MNMKISFLYESIRDIQSSIRSLDVKAGIIAALLFIPIYKLSDFSSFVSNILQKSDIIVFFFSLNALFWIFSIIIVFMAIVAISDPAEKIRGECPIGSFYGSYLFRVGWLQYLFNWPCQSTKTLQQDIAAVPSEENDIILELGYERAKLIYIRSVKNKRIFICTISTFIWLVFTVILYSACGGKT